MAATATQQHSEISFSLRAVCEATGWAPEVLAGLIYHNMKRTFTHLTDAARKVLERLLSHTNDEDNRVWASIARIAEDAPGRGGEGGLATSTVEAALADIRETGGIRPLSGEELFEGNGAHRAEERGVRRKGRHPVTHYDLGGLFWFLPPVLRDQFRAAAKRLQQEYETKSNQVAEVLKSNPSFLENEQVTPGKQESALSTPPISTSTRHDSRVSLTDTGPPGSAISSIGLGIGPNQPSPTESPRTQTTTNPQPLPRPTPRREVPTLKNRGVNYSTNGALAKPVSPWVPATEQERYAVAALQVIGLHPIRRVGGKVEDTPGEMVRTMGAKWALELVEYFFWMRRRGHNVQPGYLRNTWQNWLAGDGEWGDKFDQELDRPSRARSLPTIAQIQARLASLNQPKPEKTPVPGPAFVTAPKTAVPEPVPRPEAVAEWLLGDVPTDMRGKLLDAALAVVFAQPLFRSPERQAKIRQEGFTHPGVRIAAQEIWQKQHKKKEANGNDKINDSN